MNIISIDLSIQSTGVSIYNTDADTTTLYAYSNKVKEELEFTVNKFRIHIQKADMKFTKLSTFERYVLTAEAICAKLEPYLAPDAKIYIEGYSYASKGLVFNIGEFCALIKYQLYKKGFECDVVPSASWKKHVTGKGNSNKNAIYQTMLTSELNVVIAEFISRGIKYKKGSWIEDIVDAYCIQKYVMETNNDMG